ncbi:hypothetical protein ACFQZZ_04575 [Nocardia sp. GCM10030253]|uniref:hypothetical protein n=1 Tax=Nocardia sp. GCM10030253 TaxID=3273404 RepID=UPI00363575E7
MHGEPNDSSRNNAIDRPEHDFPDDSRTTRTHAGESIADTRNWPGIILFGVGLALVALTLTAAGYGFAGWAVIGGIACALCLATGAVLVIAEHRRVKNQEGLGLSEPRGH